MSSLRHPSLFVLVVVFASTLGACAEQSLPAAAKEGTEEIGAALARGAAIEERDEAGRTALHVAAAEGDAESVKLLLARGASAEARTTDGATPLHLAARRACAACARPLAGAMADREATAGPRNRTALHDAVLTGDETMIAALLAARLDPNHRDSFGASPLHLVASASSRRSATLAPVLLANGADWRVMDNRGFTALHAAAAVDDVVLLRAIVKKDEGAIGELNVRGETALDVAQRYGSERVVAVSSKPP